MKVSFAQQRHIEKWMRFLLLKSFRFAVLGAQNETVLPQMYPSFKTKFFPKKQVLWTPIAKVGRTLFFFKGKLKVC